MKGREIWGELVPFDQVWRLGANQATTVTFEVRCASSTGSIALTVTGLPPAAPAAIAITGPNGFTLAPTLRLDRDYAALGVGGRF